MGSTARAACATFGFSTHGATADRCAGAPTAIPCSRLRQEPAIAGLASTACPTWPLACSVAEHCGSESTTRAPAVFSSCMGGRVAAWLIRSSHMVELVWVCRSVGRPSRRGVWLASRSLRAATGSALLWKQAGLMQVVYAAIVLIRDG